MSPATSASALVKGWEVSSDGALRDDVFEGMALSLIELDVVVRAIHRRISSVFLGSARNSLPVTQH